MVCDRCRVCAEGHDNSVVPSSKSSRCSQRRGGLSTTRELSNRQSHALGFTFVRSFQGLISSLVLVFLTS